MNFISEDRKTINLPVPLGSMVYEVTTTCNDACLFQKEAFEKAFPSVEGGRCSATMPCHTKVHSITPKELTLENLDWVLKQWGFRFFETESEAHSTAVARVAEHINKLWELDLLP